MKELSWATFLVLEVVLAHRKVWGATSHMQNEGQPVIQLDLHTYSLHTGGLRIVWFAYYITVKFVSLHVPLLPHLPTSGWYSPPSLLTSSLPQLPNPLSISDIVLLPPRSPLVPLHCPAASCTLHLPLHLQPCLLHPTSPLPFLLHPYLYFSIPTPNPQVARHLPLNFYIHYPSHQPSLAPHLGIPTPSSARPGYPYSQARDGGDCNSGLTVYCARPAFRAMTKLGVILRT